MATDLDLMARPDTTPDTDQMGNRFGHAKENGPHFVVPGLVWLQPHQAFAAGSHGEQARHIQSGRDFGAPAGVDWQYAAAIGCCRQNKEHAMAKRQANTGVYRVTEIIGTSTTSWEDAAKRAVETAAKTLRDLRVAEVCKLDMTIEDGKVATYRARVMLSFKYEG